MAGVAEGWAKVPLDALGGRGLIRLMVAPLTVQLGARAYPIHFGERLAPGLRAEVAQLTAAAGFAWETLVTIQTSPTWGRWHRPRWWESTWPSLEGEWVGWVD